MRFCVMKACANESKSNNVSNGGVSYHRFPKNSTVKKEWVKATGRDHWRPSRSSFICSDHFEKKNIHVSKKGYKYLSDRAIPIQNNNFFEGQNEKQKDAENVAFENEPAPSMKLPQNKLMRRAPADNSTPSKNLSQEEVLKKGGQLAVNPGPPKNLAQGEVMKEGVVPTVDVPQVEIQNEGGEPAKNPKHAKKRCKKRSKNRCKNHEVKEGELEEPGPSKNEAEKEGEDAVAQPGPSRKRHHHGQKEAAVRPCKDEGEQGDGAAAKKARNDKDPEPNQNPPKISTKEKLYKLLRWNHEKIRKQHLKIKNLQTVNRNLTHNVRIIEEFVKILDERINMTNEDLFNFKMSLR